MRLLFPLVGLGLSWLAACDSAVRLEPPTGSLVGIWGGEDAGMIVTDSSAHVHIGCTLGDVAQAIVPDGLGQFEVVGRYNVDAYPVNRGIDHPARFRGSVAGGMMLLTVALTDTSLTLGPVRLTYGREPGMRNCPICRSPGQSRPMAR